MGELFIRKANGEEITFHADGTKTIYLNTDCCDKCNQWRAKDKGRYLEFADEKVAWFCEDCK